MIECKTYRVVGHFEGDPGINYRTKEEIAQWRVRDPIQKLSNAAVADGLVSSEELTAIERDCEREVQGAYEYARSSPQADPQTVDDHVYC